MKISLEDLLFQKNTPLPSNAYPESQEIQILQKKIVALQDRERLFAKELFNKAIDCLKNDNHIDAAGFLQAVLLHEPDNIKAMNNLAIVYFELDLPQKARHILTKILVIDPENKIAKNNIKLL